MGYYGLSALDAMLFLGTCDNASGRDGFGSMDLRRTTLFLLDVYTAYFTEVVPIDCEGYYQWEQPGTAKKGP